MHKKVRYFALLITLVMLASLVSTSTLAQAPSLTLPGDDLPANSGAAREEPDWQLSYHSGTQKARFLNTRSGAPIRQPGLLPPNATPETAALNFLSHHGEVFGLDDPANQLSVMKTRSLGDAAPGEIERSFVRYQQVHAGIPVLGGELIVQMDANQDVLSVNGEVLPDLDLDTTPTIDPETARGTALAKIARDYSLDVSELTASQPELWIYNPVLLGGPGPRFDTLVWRLDVESLDLLPIRELVLVNAQLGVIALHFNQVDTAKQRETYTANNTENLPGTLVCNESDPSCSGGDEHAKKAHEYAGDTYDFFMSEHARDSIDDAGMPMTSTVHYGNNIDNAFWNGSQMVYGDANGYPLADDVVAHELTHGVTEHESNLFYYYQSGAINESLSDIWGELVDQYGATGNDDGDTPWVIGEDISELLPPLRNMADPTLFNDPDKMTSANYYCQQTNLGLPGGDNGGVHYNSGIGNKTAYLLTDGDSFNGKTVTGLGYAKVADLFYEVQTNLLTSAADYADLYDALLQACSNLGYSPGDCQEVKDAVDATEMNLLPSSCQAPEAPICPAGQSPSNIFFDDIESGGGNWTSGSNDDSEIYWFVPQTTSGIGLAFPYATSGVGNIWGFSQDVTSDTYLAMNSDVSLSANAYLHFNHAFGFESIGARNDGGILEYSTNAGSSWSDAGSLFTHNGYNGTLDSGNPLGAIQAFSADSRGYISSRLDLSSLAGSNVRFRFRIGTNALLFDYGWFIDDVRIYTCVDTSNIYLPLVLKNFSGSSSIPNGDFESGSTNWTEYSLHGWDLILHESEILVDPHSGSWAAWLGGDYDDISYIEQTVTVPPGSPHLTYWHWIGSGDECGNDFGGVIVNGLTVVDQYDLCSLENTFGWVLHSVDLSAYAGQTISVQIRAETNTSLNSNLFVDDITFESSAASPSTMDTLDSKEYSKPKSEYSLKPSRGDLDITPRVFRR